MNRIFLLLLALFWTLPNGLAAQQANPSLRADKDNPIIIPASTGIIVNVSAQNMSPSGWVDWVVEINATANVAVTARERYDLQTQGNIQRFATTTYDGAAFSTIEVTATGRGTATVKISASINNAAVDHSPLTLSFVEDPDPEATGPVAYTITTVAGNGIHEFSGDGGPATEASLRWPNGLFVDRQGNIFIADERNHRIRKVDAQTGVITTVAGTTPAGTYSSTGQLGGDGGPATRARLNRPRGVFVDDAGNIYIADSDNDRVRRVDAQTGIITSVTGDGNPLLRPDNALFRNPSRVFVDKAGNIYVAEFSGGIQKIDAEGRITAIAGGGSAELFDGQVAATSRFGSTWGMWVDDEDNVFAVHGQRVRRIDGKTGIVSTVAGTGNAGFSGDGGPAIRAELDHPRDVHVTPAGEIYIADNTNFRIRKVNAQGIITTVAGSGKWSFSGDGGPATEAGVDIVWGVFVDQGGNIYLSDTYNHRVRKLTPVAAVAEPPAPTPDFNKDGVVDFQDFLLFAQHFGRKRGDAGFEARFDLDGDGSVGFGDFLIFAQNFGKPLP